jgi:RimJ/RimL family protein N-acetyltransferase
MSFQHVDALVEAANEDRSTYRFTKVPKLRDEMDAYVANLLADYANDVTIPFVQVDVSSDRVIGATRYLTIRCEAGRPFPFAVEIGGTWLAVSSQRTPINTEAKLLLLDFAFSTWHAVRVDFKTDARNERSRTAILRLGAVFEGVLRQSQSSLVPGEELLFRDSAYFSILDSEWPLVEANLRSKVG